MIELNPFLQSESMCGPASLKILLSHYGKDFSEDELALLCDSTLEKGTSHAGLTKAVGQLGLKYSEKADASLKDIEERVNDNSPVIIGWWSKDENHYSVVYGLDNENIYLMDPEIEGGKRVMSKKDFLDAWHDFDSATETEVSHWMLVITQPFAPEKKS